MPLYTFIADYAGGTYCSQEIAPNCTAAVLLWAENLDVKAIPGIGKKAKRKMIAKIREDEESGTGHVPVGVLCHVWFFCVRVKRKMTFIDFVQTEQA